MLSVYFLSVSHGYCPIILVVSTSVKMKESVDMYLFVFWYLIKTLFNLYFIHLRPKYMLQQDTQNFYRGKVKTNIIPPFHQPWSNNIYAMSSMFKYPFSSFWSIMQYDQCCFDFVVGIKWYKWMVGNCTLEKILKTKTYEMRDELCPNGGHTK